MPRRKDYGISNIPKDGDPRWEDWSQPLREFVQEPRTWQELIQWAKTVRMQTFLLRHCLAWLNNRRFAGSYYGSDGNIMWVWGGEATSPEHDR